MLSLEVGVNAAAWKLVIHELVVNKRFAPREWNNDERMVATKRNGERYNRTGPIIASIATPATHNTRCAAGLTVDVDEMHAIGAVLRVGQGEYRWFPDTEIIDIRCIKNDTVDDNTRALNRSWVFVNSEDDVVVTPPDPPSPKPRSPKPVTGRATREPERMRTAASNGYQMVGTIDPNLIVVTNGAEFKVLKVVASFTVDE